MKKLTKEVNEFLTYKLHRDWWNGVLAEDEIPTVDFSTWDSFGELYVWARKATWWHECYERHFQYERDNGCDCYTVDRLEAYIDPTKFALAIYEFLK